MRLIDADRLKEVLDRNFSHTGGAEVMCQIIDKQPTAYDIDKVMKRLDKASDCAEWLGKLKHYEDLEAQGRLIKMPCYVGDTMYTNYSMQGWYMHRKNRPYEAKVVFVGINGVDNFMNVELGEGKMLQFRFSDIGKKVFLTKSEAEAALKESEQE